MTSACSPCSSHSVIIIPRYDLPSALHQQIESYMLQSSNFETKFNLLYTAYSIPNMILPLFGGNVVDKYGAPTCQIIFAIIVCLGSSILSVGVSNQSWKLMYFGRFIFGLGAESLSVAQSTVLSEWFEGREVGLAMGIALSVSRLGSVWNNIISPKIANSKNGGVETAFHVGTLLTITSVVMGALIVFVDNRAKERLGKRGGCVLESYALLDGSTVQSVGMNTGGSCSNPNALANNAKRHHESEQVYISDIREFPLLFWLLSLSCVVVYGCVLPFNNVASGILLERNFFIPPPDCHLTYQDQCADGGKYCYIMLHSHYLQRTYQYASSDLQTSLNIAVDVADNECIITPSQAPILPESIKFTKFDLNSSNIGDKAEYIYPNLQPTNVHCDDKFWFEGCTMSYCLKEHAATERAGKVMSIPYLISSLSSPLLGHMVDKVGRRAMLATLASAILLIVHLSLALTNWSPIGPMILQGTAYSLYAAVLWPSVPLTVLKKYTGSAYGTITSIQNMGLALFPLVIASIYNRNGNYIPNVEIFFSVCATTGLAVGALMIRVDKQTGRKLNDVFAQNNRENAGIGKQNGDYFELTR